MRMREWGLKLMMGLSGVKAGRCEESPRDFEVVLEQKNCLLGRLLRRLLGGRGGNRFFYLPTSFSPADPKLYGYDFEEVFFETEDGVRLHAWFVQAALPGELSEPKGTVIFSHGNTGALGFHFGFAEWWVKSGYQLLMYDYRGYGQSGGEIDRENMHRDVEAAFAYVKGRADVDEQRLISFGHSLGATMSLTVFGQQRVNGVCGLISFGAFSSYVEMARVTGGEAAVKVVSDELSPRDVVNGASPLPLLLVHGTKDETVPLAQAEELFERAGQPKSLLRIEGGGHLNALWLRQGQYQREVLAWVEKVLPE